VQPPPWLVAGANPDKSCRFTECGFSDSSLSGNSTSLGTALKYEFANVRLRLGLRISC
jgi:hypothetical protein